jgi:hypothetical protein
MSVRLITYDDRLIITDDGKFIVMSGIDYSINAQPGYLNVIGQGLTHSRNSLLDTRPGVFHVVGQPIPRIGEHLLHANIGNYLTTGYPISLVRNIKFIIDPGSYNIGKITLIINTDSGSAIIADSGAVLVTTSKGAPINGMRHVRPKLQSGLYILTKYDLYFDRIITPPLFWVHNEMEFRVYMGDIVGIGFETEIDLTGCEVGIFAKRPDGSTVFWPANIDPTDNTKIWYKTYPTDLNMSGSWYIQAFINRLGVRSHGLALDMSVYKPITINS